MGQNPSPALPGNPEALGPEAVEKALEGEVETVDPKEFEITEGMGRTEVEGLPDNPPQVGNDRPWRAAEWHP